MNIVKHIIIFVLLTVTWLYAAPINTGDIIRQTKPVTLPVPKKELPSIAPLEYKAPLVVEDDVKILVKSFKFSGNTVFTSEELAKLVVSYTNRSLGLSEMKEAASLITKYYRSKGYFVARAYIPAQSLQDGIVEIAIIEGKYGKFDINNSSHVDTDDVQAYMDQLKTEQIISTELLERQMLLINDLSGAQIVNVEVSAGEMVGTSDFKVNVEPTPKYNGYVIADNYGLRYTGENRLSVYGYVNSLTGIGDTLGISALSTNTADLKNGRLSYDRPVGYSGLKTGASFSVTEYRLSDELESLESFGRIDVYNAHISYPYLKTRAHTVETELSFDHRYMKESILQEETRKATDALTLKLNNTQTTAISGLPGNLYASIGFTFGNLGFKNDKAYADDLINAHGKYAKANMMLFYNQYLAPDITLKTQFKGQMSFGKNLDSSEGISVSGSNGVRAYEDSESSGDEGYFVSFDLVYLLPGNKELSHNMSVFLDHAQVYKNTDPSVTTQENRRMLNAIGLGWNATYNAFDIKVSYAHGFGGERTPTAEAQTDTNANKLLVQGVYRF